MKTPFVDIKALQAKATQVFAETNPNVHIRKARHAAKMAAVFQQVIIPALGSVGIRHVTTGDRIRITQPLPADSKANLLGELGVVTDASGTFVVVKLDCGIDRVLVADYELGGMSHTGEQALAAKPKERPILFSAPMVQALLAGRKTQTRRIVKSQPWQDDAGYWNRENGKQITGVYHSEDAVKAAMIQHFCPYGKPGDRLWVRETWAADVAYNSHSPSRLSQHVGPLWFAAGYGREFECSERGKTRSSIHMPRWASRITLEITEVRVQRLSELTQVDAIDEGVMSLSEAWVHAQFPEYGEDYRAWEQLRVEKSFAKPPLGPSPLARFEKLWQSINGEGSWNANPFVWAVSFRVLTPEVRA